MKYDFQGIKKMGASGLRLALSTSPWTSWMLLGGPATTWLLEWFTNWLANNGLILMDAGFDLVKNSLDQLAFDSALDKAISEITIKGGRDALTIEQKKAIDDDVIKAARKFIVIGNPK